VLHQISHPPLPLDLPKASEVESYNCRECGQVINRKFIAFLNKYVFPVCRCETLKMEKEEEMRDRMHRKKQMEKAYRHNIMNDDLKEARFSNFEPRLGTETILDKSKDFAENFEHKKVGLMGFGNPGNGKSHLFASIHHYLDERGYVSLFLDCSQLFNIAEDAKKFSSKTTISEIINAAIHCDLLTLDEMGAGKITNDEFTDILFPIINGRQGKKTNYTTNLDLDEIMEWFATDKYGKPLDNKGRLIDRILGSCEIVKNNATSKRQEEAMKRFNQSAGQDTNRKWA
jgi:DNA replication protein DnaC